MVKRRRGKDRDRRRDHDKDHRRGRKRKRDRKRRHDAFGAASSGRETLQSIEKAIQDLRQREARLQTDLKRLTATRADEVTKRLNAYRELAEVKTRNAVADGVIDEADRLSTRVADLLSARQKTIDDLRHRQNAADEFRETSIDTRDRLIVEIDTLEQKLDDLALIAREELMREADYQFRSTALEELSAVHRKAAEKAERAHNDRDAKGKAYQNDPLFMYLWQRSYGQSEYRKTGIVRWLDSWVARLVGYPNARANYAVLNEIPLRLDEHVERLADRLAVSREDIERLEAAKIQELADGNLSDNLRQMHEKEVAVTKDITAATAELSDLGEQLNKYAEGHDPAFAKAIDLATEFLQQHTTQYLAQAANETSTSSDNEIVARISGLDRRVAELSLEHDRQTAELEKTFERRDELLRIAADFRRNHYDDSATEFRGEDLANAVLEDLIGGAISGAEYWGRARRRKSRRSRPADSFRRSQKFPPFDLEDMFDLDDVFDFDDDFWTEGKF